METNNNLRWQQRFSHFNKAFAQLERFIAKKDLNEIDKYGIVLENSKTKTPLHSN